MVTTPTSAPCKRGQEVALRAAHQPNSAVTTNSSTSNVALPSGESSDRTEPPCQYRRPTRNATDKDSARNPANRIQPQRMLRMNAPGNFDRLVADAAILERGTHRVGAGP